MDFTGTSEQITHTLFGAQKVKDAVVDRFRERDGRRPSVDLRNPDLRINVHLAGAEARVSLDLSGESLHKRGYRDETVEAPLKENLAAAVLIRAGWPAIAAAGGPLLDPMCGSGTIAIEAALIAGDIAPGLLRESFGFLRWPRHDAALWERLLAEARARREAGRRRFPAIVGTDHDPSAVRAALANVARAGLAGLIHIEKRELADAVPPKSRSGAPGLVATNPPYGQRLGSETELRPLYETIGAVLRERFEGWKAALLTGNPGLALRTGIRAKKAYTLFNGALECRLFIMDVAPERFMHASKPKAPAVPAGAGSGPGGTAAPAPPPAKSPSPSPTACARTSRRSDRGRAARGSAATGSTMRTCRSTRWRWICTAWRRNPPRRDRRTPPEHRATSGPSCRSTRPRRRSTRRRRARGSPTPWRPSAATLELPPERVVLKIRRQRRGREQHEKLGEEREFHRVSEGGLAFQVNFTDYLDTGLFLDTRPVRALLRTLAAGKDVLNLFCYTGTATRRRRRRGRPLDGLGRSLADLPRLGAAQPEAQRLRRAGARAGSRRLPRVGAPGAAALRADLSRPAGVLDLERDARDARHPARPRAADPRHRPAARTGRHPGLLHQPAPLQARCRGDAGPRLRGHHPLDDPERFRREPPDPRLLEDHREGSHAKRLTFAPPSAYSPARDWGG